MNTAMNKPVFKLFAALVPVVCIALFGACNEEEKRSEANIVNTFTVKGRSGADFNGVIGADNTVTIKLSPYLDAVAELDSVCPTFFLSPGATVAPYPSVPQNFAQDGGVKYTVTAEDGKTQTVYTVTWGISDPLPHGEGFTYAEVGAAKNFTQLGYPGELGNTTLPSIQYGDLLMYHAYCGDYIVLLSRVYITTDPMSPHCVKVVDKAALNDAGALNLGSIAVADLKMITSDYKGRCVGAVVTGGQTEFFYWTAPTAAPVSVGKIAVNMAESTDGSANFQVAGDIAGNAWITALAPRGPKGAHYRVKVTGGRLASEYSTVETGYSSGDCSGFQMISPLDDSDQPAFVVGDTEGTANTNNTLRAYINSFTGLTVSSMPAYWQNILQVWWVGTGASTARVGGRKPVVSALPVNGKTYVAFAGGSAWWLGATVMSADLQTAPAHRNLNIAFGVNAGWSYGNWVDWYWSEENNEAYLAIWAGRLGLYTYKLTCFE
jgi:hypothetical protein